MLCLDVSIRAAILAAHVHDQRFLRRIRALRKAGYREHWTYHATRSGAPQGSSVGPMRSNIDLARLDRYVETVLIPQYTRGSRRRYNPVYNQISGRAKY